jgi:competence protein ComEC
LFELFDDIKQHPIFRILVPFVLGIVIALWIKPVIDNFLVWMSIIVYVLMLFIVFSFTAKQYRINWIFGLFVHLGFFWMGFLLTSQYMGGVNNSSLENAEGELVGVVVSEPEIKEKTIKVKVDIEAYRIKNNWYGTQANMLLYLEKNQDATQLKLGDKIVFSPELTQYQNSGNPEEFDYEKYMWHQLIAYSDYINSTEWMKIGQSRTNRFAIYASKIRNGLVNIYRKSGLCGDELAVASALTLGTKSNLSDSVRQSYSISGGMHVLAVSGLHVGIVFLVINSLLAFFKKRKFLIIKTVLIVCTIWFFAFITGFSPSVTRAALMFSFFAFSKLMKKNPGFLNILSASALISLIINPFAITEIGFQLSYAAVGAIVFFHPYIYGLIYIKNRQLDKVWSLIAVSLAAQIGTAPFGLFYFNQFSNYFLLTNLLLIPLVSIAIYLAMLLIIVSPIAVLSKAVGFVFSFVIKIMNGGVSFIEQLPLSSSEIYINLFQFIVLLSVVVLLMLFLEYRKSNLFLWSLTCVALFLGSSLLNKFQQSNQRNVVVYNIKNTAAINLIDGTDNLLISNLESNLVEDNSQVFKKFWLSRGLDEEKRLYMEQMTSENILQNIIRVDNPHIFVKNGFIGFYNIRIAIVGEDILLPVASSIKIPVDVLIVTGARGKNADFIKQHFTFKYLVIDSSVATNIANSIEEKLSFADGKIYNVQNLGAFLLSDF